MRSWIDRKSRLARANPGTPGYSTVAVPTWLEVFSGGQAAEEEKKRKKENCDGTQMAISARRQNRAAPTTFDS